MLARVVASGVLRCAHGVGGSACFLGISRNTSLARVASTTAPAAAAVAHELRQQQALAHPSTATAALQHERAHRTASWHSAAAMASSSRSGAVAAGGTEEELWPESGAMLQHVGPATAAYGPLAAAAAASNSQQRSGRAPILAAPGILMLVGCTTQAAAEGEEDVEDDDVLDEYDCDSDSERGVVARREMVQDPYVIEFLISLNLPGYKPPKGFEQLQLGTEGNQGAGSTPGSSKQQVPGKKDKQGASSTLGGSKQQAPSTEGNLDASSTQIGSKQHEDISKWSSCEQRFPDPSMDPKLYLNKAAWQWRGSSVHVWAPHLTHADIMGKCFKYPKGKRNAVPPCPRCHSVDGVTPEEWSKAPRRVIGLDRSNLLLSYRYRCQRCPKARTKAQGGQQKCTSFSAHDKGAMAQLPDALRRTFPFVVTHRAAVTKQVVDAMSTLVISPASFSHFARTVREGHAGYILSSNEALASMAEMQRSQGSMAARGAVAPLDTKVSTPGAGYYINIFLNAVDECRRRQHYQQLLQLTVSPIWRFDHCHKPSKLVRLKDGSRASEGTGVLAGCFMQIMGWWNVDSTSLDVVKEPLRLVRERCKALGTDVCVLYVDNAQSTAHKWKEVLGDDVVLKQDPWHMQQRIMRAVGDPQHPALDSFRGDICKAIMRAYGEDAVVLQGQLDSPTISPQAKMQAWKRCMKVIDSGEKVWERLTAVFKWYDKHTKGLITDETKKALANQEELITSGYLTDPFPPELMYYRDRTGVLRSHRSESQAENIIGRLNKIFSGSNMSGEVADALTLDWAGRANVDAAVTHQELPNFHVKDLVRLSDVNERFTKLDGQPPYPGVTVGRPAAIQEQFGYSYTPPFAAAAGGICPAAAAGGSGAPATQQQHEELVVDDGLQLSEKCFDRSWLKKQKEQQAEKERLEKQQAEKQQLEGTGGTSSTSGGVSMHKLPISKSDLPVPLYLLHPPDPFAGVPGPVLAPLPATEQPADGAAAEEPADGAAAAGTPLCAAAANKVGTRRSPRGHRSATVFDITSQSMSPEECAVLDRLSNLCRQGQLQHFIDSLCTAPFEATFGYAAAAGRPPPPPAAAAAAGRPSVLQLLEAAERAVQKHSVQQREHAAHRTVNFGLLETAWNAMLDHDRAPGVSSSLPPTFTKKTPQQLRRASGAASQRHYTNLVHAAMQGSSGALGAMQQTAVPGSAAGEDHGTAATAAAAAAGAAATDVINQGTAGPPGGLAQQVAAGGRSPVKDAFSVLFQAARRAASSVTAGFQQYGSAAAGIKAIQQPATGPPAAAGSVMVAGGSAAASGAQHAAMGTQQAGAKRAADAAAAARPAKRPCKSGADRKPTQCGHCGREGHNKRSCPDRKQSAT